MEALVEVCLDEDNRDEERIDHSCFVGKKRGPKIKKEPNDAYPCEVCTYTTGRKHDLKRHHDKIHGPQSKVKVKVERKRKQKEKKVVEEEVEEFEDGKIKHNVVVKGRKRGPKMKNTYDKTFPCLHCTYASTRRFDLKRHISVVHNKEKPFTCDVCSFSAGLAETLKQHMLKVHQEHKFKCNACLYTCLNRTEYVKHLMKEHDYMPHSCNSCEFSCTRYVELKKHMFKEHKEIKPYKCTQCDYRGVHKTNLIKHVNYHHMKDVLLKCDICDFTTNNGKYELAIHKRRKHAPKPNSELEPADKEKKHEHSDKTQQNLSETNQTEPLTDNEPTTDAKRQTKKRKTTSKVKKKMSDSPLEKTSTGGQMGQKKPVKPKKKRKIPADCDNPSILNEINSLINSNSLLFSHINSSNQLMSNTNSLSISQGKNNTLSSSKPPAKTGNILFNNTSSLSQLLNKPLVNRVEPASTTSHVNPSLNKSSSNTLVDNLSRDDNPLLNDNQSICKEKPPSNSMNNQLMQDQHLSDVNSPLNTVDIDCKPAVSELSFDTDYLLNNSAKALGNGNSFNYINQSVSVIQSVNSLNHQSHSSVNQNLNYKQFEASLNRNKSTQERLEVHVCDLCPFSTSTNDLLNKHIVQVHSKNRIFVCSLCRFESPRKYNFKHHLKFIHNVGDQDLETVAVSSLKTVTFYGDAGDVYNSFPADDLKPDLIFDSDTNDQLNSSTYDYSKMNSTKSFLNSTFENTNTDSTSTANNSLNFNCNYNVAGGAHFLLGKPLVHNILTPNIPQAPLEMKWYK